jgi:general nucleoside transport system permease protein
LRDDRRAFWVGLSGFLRYARGVNETISSLLLPYIGIPIMNFFVEGALRDSSNPNKPSTLPIGEAYMVGKIPEPKCTGDSHSASAFASRSIS